MTKTYAVTKRVDQVGPDDWETTPVVVDVPDDMTMGELRRLIRLKLAYPGHPPTTDDAPFPLTFSIVYDPRTTDTEAENDQKSA